jgi:DTW domain-containing protein
MHVGLCLCATLPRLVTRTRVVLVMHRVEHRKPTNTGRIALACLPSAELVLRGERAGGNQPVVDEMLAGLDAARDAATASEPLLLFPHEDAVPLTARPAGAPPVTLVVPDGTWRQASKVRARTPGLARVPAVTLPPGPPSRYRLRTEAHPAFLSTLEALARALGILEGPEVQRALEDVFDAVVHRTLWVRGEMPDEEVHGGLPPLAERHDPVSGLRERA